MFHSSRVALPLLVTLAVLGILVVAGCPKSAPQGTPEGGGPSVVPPAGVGPGTGAGGAAPSGEPIKIGAIFSVTGPTAPPGEPEKMAAEMIAAQINEKGGILGRPVEVIIEDDKSENTEAVMAAKKLIETEKVCAIIGPSGTPATMAIKQMCQDAGVPLVSCAAGRTITDPVFSNVFAVPQTDLLAVAKIVDWLKANKITKVASIYVANPFGESGQQQMEKQFKEAGIQLLASEKFGGEDTDMTPQLTNIKGKNPEAIICWGTNPGPASVAKGVKKLGITVPLIQSHGVANAKFIELAGEAAEGVMLPAGRLIVWQSVPDDHKQKPVLKEFAEAFKAKYDRDADTFAGHAYDALHIVAKAIEAAGSDEPAKVRDAIEKTTDFVGTAGVFNYSADDHNGLTKDAFVWVKIEGGQWKLAE